LTTQSTAKVKNARSYASVPPSWRGQGQLYLISNYIIAVKFTLRNILTIIQ
jgi:hypothetical protein